MDFLAIDSETDLIRPGMLAPRGICGSWAMLERGTDLPAYLTAARAHWDERTLRPTFGLLAYPAFLRLLRRSLADPAITLVGHNAPYDLAVACVEDPALLPLVFRAYADGRVRDTLTREQLISIACGEMKFYEDEETGRDVKSEFSLAAVVRKRLGRWVEKEAEDPSRPGYWRLRYRELAHLPPSDWPEPARRYAIGDSVDTLDCFWTQVDYCRREGLLCRESGDDTRIPDEIPQQRASWVLHLLAAWGVRTDAEAVAALERRLTARRDDLQSRCIEAGLVRPARYAKRDPSRLAQPPSKDMAAIRARIVRAWEGESARAAREGRPAPALAMTDGTARKPPEVSTGRRVLLESGDPDLALLAELGKTEKILGTYVPPLWEGARGPLCARYNTLVESGRISCSGPNMTNAPRSGGVRECFVARPGRVFVFCDYDTAEMRAWAQVCLDFLGYSALAEELNAGEDPHLTMAAELMGISREDLLRLKSAGDPRVKEYRQRAKIPNFGLPGGMRVRGLIAFAAGYEGPDGRPIRMSEAEAEEIIATWERTRPEGPAYFRLVGELLGPAREGIVRQARSGRVRGGVTFTAACNTFFQGLVADGAKAALWDVACECYLGAGVEVATALRDDGKIVAVPVPVEERSALFGSRPCIFVHDEIVTETPFDPRDPGRASAAADRLRDLMVAAMARYIPDVKVRASAVLSRRWYKGAEEVREGGISLPVRPNPEPRREGVRWRPWVADREALQEENHAE